MAETLLEVGGAMAKSGACAEATAPIERALAILETHPLSSRALDGWLGNAIRELVSCGAHGAARRFLEHAGARWARAHGPDHPLTVWTLDELGEIASALGDIEAAVALHRDAVARRQRFLARSPEDEWAAYAHESQMTSLPSPP